MLITLALTLLLTGAKADTGRASLDGSTPARDTLVLAYEFTGETNEFARVELQAGQVYRVEVDGGRNVQVRALRSGEQRPRFGQIEPNPRASRTAAFEVVPFVTTIYEIRIGSIPRGVAPLRVYWDANATARRQKLRAKS